MQKATIPLVNTVYRKVVLKRGYLRVELSFIHVGHVWWCDNIGSLASPVKQQMIVFKVETSHTELMVFTASAQVCKRSMKQPIRI